MVYIMIQVKTLKTERLVLKKITKKNLNDYVEWKSNREYHKFLPTDVKTKQEYEISLNSIIKNYDNKDEPNLLWGIFYNNKLIGSVSIEDWNIKHKWCEIGWGLSPKFQNQGFAYEAVKCLINYIFNIVKMNRIKVVIWNKNDASKKLASKLGFVQEGIERKARIKNNKFVDLYCYGLLKEEWGKI